LAWWSEAIKRGLVGAQSKCETCMETQTNEQRQILGCGYVAPLDESRRRHIPIWQGGSLPNYKGPKTTVCPGYSTALPEVIETVRAHRHWSKGNYQVADREPRDAQVIALEIFDASLSEYQSWSMTSEEDGGGRRAK
jgi:hypothetical protein